MQIGQPKILYGMFVHRSKKQPPRVHRPVWCGITEESRREHQQWILNNVADVNYDGETTFDNCRSAVVIDKPGLYTFGKLQVQIYANDGVRCHGYTQKITKSGKLMNHKILVGYVNGEHNELSQLNLADVQWISEAASLDAERVSADSCSFGM